MHVFKRLRCSVLVSSVAIWAGVASADMLPMRSKYDVSLYGFVKVDAAYDTQRTAAGNLTFFVLPEGADGKQDEFNLTAKETRLGLAIGVPDIEGVRVSGRAEIDFYGGGSENAANPRLRLAYLDLAKGSLSLRAGQDWDTFISVLPRMANGSPLWNSGLVGVRRPQIRVTQSVHLSERTKLTTKVAVARTIGQDLDGAGQDDGAAAGHPSGQGNLALASTALNGRRIVLSVSGHAGSEKVSAYIDNTDPLAPVSIDEKNYGSWSLIGSLCVPLADWLAVNSSVWVGENLATYFGGIGQGINKAKQTEIAAQGGWAQVLLTPSSKWNVNLGYGVDEPDDADLHAGNRSKNETFFGNVFYTVNEAVTLATEVSHMVTSYKGAGNEANNRVQASLIMRF